MFFMYISVTFFLYFFFCFFSSRRRHTRLQGDWSSDVCSSDLFIAVLIAQTFFRAHGVGDAMLLLKGMAGLRGVEALESLSHLQRSEEHTSELQSPCNLVCRLLLEKKKQNSTTTSVTYVLNDSH